MQKPVVIVGAGLSGLIVARELHRAGVYFLLLDSSDRPGGRLKTEKVDGFLLDRGFQVYFTAYPNCASQLNLDALDLHSFRNGSVIHGFDGLHTFDSSLGFRKKIEMMRDKFLSKSDKKHALSFNDRMSSISLMEVMRAPAITSEQYLLNEGFSHEFVDKFARPFFGGVFADRSLNTTARQLVFVAKALAQGKAALPAKGMEAIPQQILEEIPRYLLRMNSKVAEVIVTDGQATGVRLDTSEVIEASAVVIATDAPSAAKLAGIQVPEGKSSSISLWFETAVPCVDDAYIVLNGTNDGIVNSVVPVTNAAPSYAPAGKHLACATIVGGSSLSDDALAEQAKKEIEAWFPGKGVNMWRFLKADRIAYAQMPLPVGAFAGLPGNTTSTKGLYLAGEFTENSSIDGAICSGIRCAEAVVDGHEGEAAA